LVDFHTLQQQNNVHLLPASATGASEIGTRGGTADDELLKFNPAIVAPLLLIWTAQHITND